MDASFPPFASIASDGSLVGLDVDLAREISRRAGVQPQFVANLPYDGLYDALTANQVDIVISALPINPARMEDHAYSRVYFVAGQVLVSREGQENALSMADLSGRRLAVVLGTEGDRQGREWARRLADLTVVQHRTPAEALDAVENGDVDVGLVDRVSAMRRTGEEGGLIIVGEPVIKVEYAAAVRRDSVRLLQEVNEALRSMEDDGTLDALISEWLR